jgi:hypothetical protein
VQDNGNFYKAILIINGNVKQIFYLINIFEAAKFAADSVNLETIFTIFIEACDLKD